MGIEVGCNPPKFTRQVRGKLWNLRHMDPSTNLKKMDAALRLPEAKAPQRNIHDSDTPVTPYCNRVIAQGAV